MSNIIEFNSKLNELTSLEICIVHINNYFSSKTGQNVINFPGSCKNNATLRRLILNLEATYSIITVDLALRSCKKYKIVQNMLKSA